MALPVFPLAAGQSSISTHGVQPLSRINTTADPWHSSPLTISPGQVRHHRASSSTSDVFSQDHRTPSRYCFQGGRAALAGERAGKKKNPQSRSLSSNSAHLSRLTRRHARHPTRGATPASPVSPARADRYRPVAWSGSITLYLRIRPSLGLDIAPTQQPSCVPSHGRRRPHPGQAGRYHPCHRPGRSRALEHTRVACGRRASRTHLARTSVRVGEATAVSEICLGPPKHESQFHVSRRLGPG